jgi:hypothetical protein
LPDLHLARHTDWFTDDLFMIESAEHFVFSYSRFYADMERLDNHKVWVFSIRKRLGE